ncbi:hypothetical protein [Fredinandcohnia sp. 179-A 10B2 NHS]|uniref:hypothetical protein n=1 Tax=Fredinandcohnia sp. 179-A 10B2 NHS TaxID=3235176 RepID=UPI0039A2A1D7
MRLVIYAVVMCFAFYFLFIKKRDGKREKSAFEKVLVLSFAAFWGGLFLLKSDIFVWFFSFTGLLLLFYYKPKITRIVGTILIVFLFSTFRVPTDTDAFLNWVSKNEQLSCPSGFDCIKVYTEINEKGELVTKGDKVPILYHQTNWYLLFATGSMAYESSTGEEVQYEGVNIAGWWINTSK